LRPVEFDQLGLVASLNKLISDWNINSGGTTHYQLMTTGHADDLSETIGIALFRIAQEALTNIAKHAAARQVSVRLDINPEAVQLCIEDDGIADRLPFVQGNGIGLLGIRERLAVLHGQLRLSIAEPHGLLLTAWLPLDTANENAA